MRRRDTWYGNVQGLDLHDDYSRIPDERIFEPKALRDREITGE